jgi:hypothetical protein
MMEILVKEEDEMALERADFSAFVVGRLLLLMLLLLLWTALLLLLLR